MIDVKIIKKAKNSSNNTGGGMASGGNGYAPGGMAKEALHAVRSDVSDFAETAGKALEAERADYAKEAEHAASARDLDANSPVRDEFLSKVRDDRSSGVVASDKAFEVGEFVSGVSGAMLGRDAETGKTFGEMDHLFVRVKAFFETLTVIEANTLAGRQYITPGGAVKCTGVEKTDGGWRCYFLSSQDGEQTETKMVAGDLAISEMFNAASGTHNKVSNRRYWREVMAVENDAVTDESGNHYGCITLSESLCEDGSDAPQAGDTICQLGNRTESERQAAMIFSTVGTDAPSIRLFRGIDDFTLEGKDEAGIGYDAVKGKPYLRCYGDALLGDRSRKKSYLEYDSTTGEMDARLRLNLLSTVGSGGQTLGDLADAASGAVTGTEVLYRTGGSNTVAPALPTVTGGTVGYNGWSPQAPVRGKGDYLWSVTLTRKGDGSVELSDAVWISGLDGGDGSPGTPGADGVGIDRIAAEFYLSSSRTEAVDGQWVEEKDKPEWVPGWYWWTRSHIYYTDGTDAVAGAVCATGNDGSGVSPQLLLNSGFQGKRHWGLSAVGVSIDTANTHGGSNSMCIISEGETSDRYRGINQRYMKEENPALALDGQSYVTVSLWAKTDDTASFDENWTEAEGQYAHGAFMELHFTDLEDADIRAYRTVSIRPTKANECQRFAMTVPTGIATGASAMRFSAYVVRNGRLWISQPMVEWGRTASDWAPSAHDMDYVAQAILDARGENGSFDGGLILASLLRLGFTPDDGGEYRVMAGLNGQARRSDGRDIALFLGGDMVDAAETDDPASAATTVLRMDGTGYFAGNTVKVNENNITIGDNVVLDDVGIHLMADGRELMVIKNSPVSTDLDANLGAPEEIDRTSSDMKVAIGYLPPRSILAKGLDLKPTTQGKYYIYNTVASEEVLNGGAVMPDGSSVSVQGRIGFMFTLPTSSDGIVITGLTASGRLSLIKGTGEDAVTVKSVNLSYQTPASNRHLFQGVLNADSLEAGVYTVRVELLEDPYSGGSYHSTASGAEFSLTGRATQGVAQQNMWGSDGLQLSLRNLQLLARPGLFGVRTGDYALRMTAAGGFEKREPGSADWVKASI